MKQYYSDDEFIQDFNNRKYDHKEVVIVKDELGICVNEYLTGSDEYVMHPGNPQGGELLAKAIRGSEVDVFTVVNDRPGIIVYYGRMGFLPTQAKLEKIANKAQGKTSNEKDKFKKIEPSKGMRRILTLRYMLSKMLEAKEGSRFVMPPHDQLTPYDQAKGLPFTMEWFQELHPLTKDFYKYVTDELIYFGDSAEFIIKDGSIEIILMNRSSEVYKKGEFHSTTPAEETTSTQTLQTSNIFG